MITYILSQIRRLLREAPTDAHHVVLSRTRYTIQMNGTLHRVRHDAVDGYIECDCGGTPQFPCPALPLVQDYLVASGLRPLGRHESTWPEAWAAVPPRAPSVTVPRSPTGTSTVPMAPAGAAPSTPATIGRCG